MKYFAITLCLAALFCLTPLATRAQEARFKGIFIINRESSDDVNKAIDAAVAKMSFVTRPTARGRLRRTNPAYRRIVINYSPKEISVGFDARKPVVSPANGQIVKWTREDGEKFDLSTKWENGYLEQNFKGADGSRTNVFSVSADGGTLTLSVTLKSPRLPRPLTYKLVYNRNQ